MRLSKSVTAAEFRTGRAALLKMILDESDKRINAQVQVMVASDARATGILAAAVALAAAAFALAASHTGDNESALFWAALTFGTAAAASALAAVWALWPKAINVSGWSPRLFRNDMKKNLSAIRAEMIALNQSKILENDSCSSDLMRRVRLAMSLLALGPLAGAISGGLAIGTTLSTGAAALLSELVFILSIIVFNGTLKK